MAASPSTADIDKLLKTAVSPELLTAILRGHCGEMARGFVLDRLRHLLEQFSTKLGSARFDVIPDEKEPDRLRGIGFVDEPDFDLPDDSVYLKLVPAAMREGLLPILLETLRAIDLNASREIKRLRRTHPNIRGAWIDHTYRTVLGLPGGFGPQHLYRVLTSFSNIPLRRGGEPEVLEPVAEALAQADEYKPGQLLFLLAAFKSFAPLHAAPPAQFSRVVETLWNQRIAHLRLMTLDAVRTWGRNLDRHERTAVGDLLHSWLSDNDLWTNSIIFEALKEMGELRHGLTVESIVQEYRSFLSQPPTKDTAELAMTMYTSTYDHPLSELYYEAYHKHLRVEERHQIAVLALQSDRESIFKAWLVSDLVDEPTPLAIPYLQPLAKAPARNTTCDQDSVWVFSSAVAVLAILGAPLPPYENVSSVDERAWRLAAPLLCVLHRFNYGHQCETDEISECWGRFESVGTPAALDVIVRVHDRYIDSHIGMQATLGERCGPGICRLCRTSLSGNYVATTYLRERRHFDDLEHNHRVFAFEFLGNNGRQTDLPLVRSWIDNGRYGEMAHSAARKIEARYGTNAPQVS